MLSWSQKTRPFESIQVQTGTKIENESEKSKGNKAGFNVAFQLQDAVFAKSEIPNAGVFSKKARQGSKH